MRNFYLLLTVLFYQFGMAQVQAPVFSYPTPNVFERTQQITALMPTSTGDPVVSYSISPELPDGLFFNSTNGRISGAPNATQTPTNYVITATNTGGSTSVTISIEVKAAQPISFSYASPQVYTVNAAISPLTPTVTGCTLSSFSVSPALPSGLSLDTSTGVITGTPLAASSQGTYTISATGLGIFGSLTADLVITVQGQASAPSISYTSPQVYTVNTAISPLTPTVTGGTLTLFSISPTLPSGLSLSTSTGVITGTPLATSTQKTYTITAQGNGISGVTATLVITVQSVPTAIPIISYTTPQVYTIGTKITSLYPTSTGGKVVSYSVLPSLPVGLSMNPTTGVITGTPELARASTKYNITATNASGEFTFELTIEVPELPLVKPSITYQKWVFKIGTPNTLLVPRFLTKGVVESYSISPDLPDGLLLNTTTGIISGTPTAVSAAKDYTVTATNKVGTSTCVVNLESIALTKQTISYPASEVYFTQYEVEPLTPTKTNLSAEPYVLTVAGTGLIGSKDGIISDASFFTPNGVAFDATGNLYISDFDDHKIRKISPAGVVSTLAGNGNAGSTDGLGSEASFYSPSGIAVDSAGNVYVADTYNHKIRKITPDGTVVTLAGSSLGFLDGEGAAAKFNCPRGVAVDVSGNVYVADSYNNRIRKITPAGVVSTLAGSSTSGSNDGAGDVAKFYTPYDVALDATGNVFVCDINNNRIRKITPEGVVSTFASNVNNSTYLGFGPSGIAVDDLGNVYVSDLTYNRIIKITPNGVATHFAGSTYSGSFDGIGTSASFYYPMGVAVDKNGIVYVADSKSKKIRKIINTKGYSVTPPLPAGLNLNSVDGTIFGKPTAVSAAANYTITVSNDTDSSSTALSIEVKELIAPVISYTTPQIYSNNIAIAELTPNNTGGPGTYTVAPALPKGLQINPKNGVISGAPTAISAAADYKVTATNDLGASETTVNITIKALTVSKNNFKVEIKGESCPNDSNGSVKITATDAFTYNAVVNDKPYDFTDKVLNLEKLAPATYNIGVGIVGTNFKQSFSIVVKAAAPLTAKSSLMSGWLDVDIEKGTAPYSVSINGNEQFETESSSFTVAVNSGDEVEVKTAKACEGVYSKSIDKALGNVLACFPNPTQGSFEISMPSSTETSAEAHLFSMGGQLLSKANYPINNEKILLSLDGKPDGMYIAKVYIGNKEYVLKIIKK